jgi:HPr kinase/phosphorylase
MVQTVHATTVAIDGKGVMLTGKAGAGKSALALALMALGAQLVADDRTELEVKAGQVIARCPKAIRGLIEARGLGILNADSLDCVALHLVIDLDHPETERVPPKRAVTYSGIAISLVHMPQSLHFPAAVLHYVRHGRQD